MGLDRVVEVRERMGLRPSFPIISVGGTNGKGSTCAILEAIYKCAGYKTGLYTSPHLVSYNERVRVNGQEVKDEELVGAGIGPGTIRVSIGVENAEDLIWDLEQGLPVAEGERRR